MGGPKGKIQNPCQDYPLFFWIFPFGHPYDPLNELKFWEASENDESNIWWKFQLSISCGTQKSAKVPQTVAKMIWSFYLGKMYLILSLQNLISNIRFKLFHY